MPKEYDRLYSLHMRDGRPKLIKTKKSVEKKVSNNDIDHVIEGDLKVLSSEKTFPGPGCSMLDQIKLNEYYEYNKNQIQESKIISKETVIKAPETFY